MSAWAEPPPSSLVRPLPLSSEASSVAPSSLHPRPVQVGFLVISGHC